MSNQNFVSYADAETLMSGIKSAIGAVNVNILEYTSDGVEKWGEFLDRIYADLVSKKTAEELMTCNCAYINTATSGWKAYSLKPLKITADLSLMLFQGLGNYSIITAQPSSEIDTGYTLRLESNNLSFLYIGTTKYTRSNTPSAGNKFIFKF